MVISDAIQNLSKDLMSSKKSKVLNFIMKEFNISFEELMTSTTLSCIENLGEDLQYVADDVATTELLANEEQALVDNIFEAFDDGEDEYHDDDDEFF